MPADGNTGPRDWTSGGTSTRSGTGSRARHRGTRRRLLRALAGTAVAAAGCLDDLGVDSSDPDGVTGDDPTATSTPDASPSLEGVRVRPTGVHVSTIATSGEHEVDPAGTFGLDARGTLENHACERRTCDVRHVLEGATLDSRTIELPPGGRRTVTFRTEITRADGDGPHGIAVDRSRHQVPLRLWWGPRPTANPVWLRTVDDLRVESGGDRVVVGARATNRVEFYSGVPSPVALLVDGRRERRTDVELGTETPVSFDLPAERVDGTHSVGVAVGMARRTAQYTVRA